MAQQFRRLRRDKVREPKPTLRIYDRRTSQLLASMPDPSVVPPPHINLVGWLENRKSLIAPGGNRSIRYRVAKRLIDVVGAAALLILFAPVLIPVCLVLYISTGGHPLFRQTRVGQCGRRFQMLKFRTMRLDAHLTQPNVANEQSGPVFKNRQDPRVTRLGSWLRRLSIDEMPQILNVLRGEMSLVGPRPPIPTEVAHYEPWQAARLSVKPGLTCIWQVSGRCEIQFQDWMRLDLWYVQNQSLWVDFVLLMRTPWSVLTCRGAY
jgi:lipopolysaccharide/colanic/teichoic acid biosynthesis glycosyltransferase